MHPAFAPYAHCLDAPGGLGEVPTIATLNRVAATSRLSLPNGKALQFETAPARRSGALAYERRIADEGVIEFRVGHWHDFANALVWGTFPRGKAALHRRQAALVAARIEPGAARLPVHRTREQDGLAMIDEGGVLALAAPAAELRLVFGHALYEGFVLGVARMTARMVRLPVAALDGDAIAQADAALAAWLADPTRSTDPAALPCVLVPNAAVAPWVAPQAGRMR